MRECPEMEWIVSRMGDDATEEDREQIGQHIASCVLCQAQLRRLALAARLLVDFSPDPVQPGDHVSDLDLATFAARGFDAEGAAETVEHLARCPHCRRDLWAVRVALDESDELFGDGDDPGFRASTRAWVRRVWSVARSGPRGAGLLLSAAVCYLIQCLGFAAAATQLALAYVVCPGGYSAVPVGPPLSLLPEGALRLWAFIACALAVAAGCRYATRALFEAALTLGGRPKRTHA